MDSFPTKTTSGVDEESILGDFFLQYLFDSKPKYESFRASLAPGRLLDCLNAASFDSEQELIASALAHVLITSSSAQERLTLTTTLLKFYPELEQPQSPLLDVVDKLIALPVSEYLEKHWKSLKPKLAGKETCSSSTPIAFQTTVV